ncbi:MAG: hypothetical protein KAJ19_17650 [Gammaproteobacteria bacterium]|nr:hypothetical protein [Gammaproteobacteria bacterium]
MENLDLIDWRMVGFSSLWILGLSIILTVLGFADYHAKTRKRRFREELRGVEYQRLINIGLALFCLGLLGSSSTWWEKVLWGLLALSFTFFAAQSWWEKRPWSRSRSGNSDDSEPIED